MRLKEKNIVIIDYQMGNLFSIKNALLTLGFDPKISADKDLIYNAEALILPGVGAYGDAMANLIKLDLVNPILDHIKNEKLFMGICLGMQLLFNESQEFGYHKGLGVIEGSVKKFINTSKKIIVPQIGWNQITEPPLVEWEYTPLKNIPNKSYMYFVHSYYVVPSNASCILSNSNYEDIEYCSAISYRNIFATQFHPEKSGALGINIYSEFLNPLTIKYE